MTPINTITITILGLSLFSNCHALTPDDSCDPSSPLYAGLSQQEKDECEDGTGDGEADEEEAEVSVTCPLGGVYPGGYCWDGVWTAAQLGVPESEIEVIPKEECRTLSENTMPCRRAWNGEPYPGGPSECVMCDAFHAGAVDIGPAWADQWMPDGFGPFAPREVDFAVCHGAVDYFGSSWDADAGAADAFLLSEVWAQPLGCHDYSLFGPFDCDPVQVMDITDPETNRPQANWMCSCVNDFDCHPGTVCEAGVVWQDGNPVPTMCMPAGMEMVGGPLVYGLECWEDGVSVRGTDVIMSPSMVYAATVGQAGLWNDNQSFDEDTGELLHCGDESLCSYLGLLPGDIVSVDGEIDEARAMAGAEIPISVHRDGVLIPWTLTVAALD